MLQTQQWKGKQGNVIKAWWNYNGDASGHCYLRFSVYNQLLLLGLLVWRHVLVGKICYCLLCVFKLLSKEEARA